MSTIFSSMNNHIIILDLFADCSDFLSFHAEHLHMYGCIIVSCICNTGAKQQCHLCNLSYHDIEFTTV